LTQSLAVWSRVALKFTPSCSSPQSGGIKHVCHHTSIWDFFKSGNLSLGDTCLKEGVSQAPVAQDFNPKQQQILLL
jgi:hypothetical protein